jgi:Inhibitor of Apoptosis domain
MPARKASGSAPPKASLYNAAMAFEEARRSSFKTTAPHQWPHPTSGRSKSVGFPTPDDLARAGLYFDAEASSSGTGQSGKGKAKSDQATDVCTHYICGTQVSGWRAGDDPIARLREENSTCPSVLLLDSVEGQVARDEWAKEGKVGTAPESVWTNETLLPTSETMMETRLLTFGDLWPYDKKKGWKPTSVKVRWHPP